MSKIHPAVNIKCQLENQRDINNCEESEHIVRGHPLDNTCPTKLTVWKRSSMSFHGTDGFTVFDEHGRLVFRVENYSRKNGCTVAGSGDLLLMDGAGNALLTLRPQVFSMQGQWNAYPGEYSGSQRLSPNNFRVFSMRRASPSVKMFIPNRNYYSHRSKLSDGEGDKEEEEIEAEVFMGESKNNNKKKKCGDYRIEGSYIRRKCCIRKSSTGEMVAKISRKRVNPRVLLSAEVFSLQVVQPAGIDSTLLMAFVVVLDRICCKPFLPLLCS